MVLFLKKHSSLLLLYQKIQELGKLLIILFGLSVVPKWYYIENRLPSAKEPLLEPSYEDSSVPVGPKWA